MGFISALVEGRDLDGRAGRHVGAEGASLDLGEAGGRLDDRPQHSPSSIEQRAAIRVFSVRGRRCPWAEKASWAACEPVSIRGACLDSHRSRCWDLNRSMIGQYLHSVKAVVNLLKMHHTDGRSV